MADVYERYHDPDTNPLLDKAIAAYQVPVEMKPDDPIGYRQVANLLNKYGRFDETMEWLGRARDVNPANPEGYYLIATYYWDKVYRDPDLTERERREFIDLGIEQLDLALERNDEYVDALVYKNLLLRELAKVDPPQRVGSRCRGRRIPEPSDRYPRSAGGGSGRSRCCRCGSRRAALDSGASIEFRPPSAARFGRGRRGFFDSNPGTNLQEAGSSRRFGEISPTQLGRLRR
ncbi:hypothetical protein GBAR_LOCUS13105 [Geodia barretti]|uniref:Tetratricopeptide repeat protein n=1 Tax=Geodia barretti TaxID=519541 RepID=A0AA35WPV3_GEOBA|nr:hypothetical protein GBAR_LOCUS13105 [Geodia barretti]